MRDVLTYSALILLLPTALPQVFDLFQHMDADNDRRLTFDEFAAGFDPIEIKKKMMMRQRRRERIDWRQREEWNLRIL